MALTLPPTEDRALTIEERSAIIERTSELLELTYRAGAHGRQAELVDELAYLILTRNPRSGSNHGVYRHLLLRWGCWEEVRRADPAAITAVLKESRVPAQRTRHLLDLLERIRSDCAERGYPGVSLGWVGSLGTQDAARYLGSLPRVHDTEANRLARRLKIEDDLDTDMEVNRVVTRMGLHAESSPLGGNASLNIPQRVDSDLLRLNLQHHARSRCLPNDPDCGACPLISFCSTGRRNASGTGKPVALELFAGGGGLGEGFERAGFDVALAVDMDRDAAQTYRLNHPGTVVLEADATALSGEDLTFLSPRVATATALMAGPPCQGYSVAGYRRADDARNRLYTAVVNVAADLRPRFVVIENVPGMRRVGGEGYVDAVLEALGSVGYNADEHVLRACDYGVPQLRRRMIFLAQLKEHGEAPISPKPTHCAGAHCTLCRKFGLGQCGLEETPTVLETLTDLLPLPAGVECEYLEPGGGAVPLTNASTMAHSNRVVDKIAAITPGGGPISYRRLHPDIARTIVAGHRALPVHPTLNRTISVREAARIQGFSDRHVFAGKRSKQPLQVANAVPPALGEAIALALRNCMLGTANRTERVVAAERLVPSRGRVVRRVNPSSAK